MSSPDLKVSIPPLPKSDVECFEEFAVPLIITSQCVDPIVIESVTLRFQTDAGMSDFYHKTDIGHEINPNGLYSKMLKVTSTPEFLTNTNVFSALIRYRRVPGGVPGDQMSAMSPGRYVIIRPASQKIGRLFVSFKQPEDGALARLLKKVAERAGFEPYVAMDEPKPGEDIWKRIKPVLRKSKVVAFIWTENTVFGEGVAREIELCKAGRIKYVLLLQQDCTPPPQFKGSTIEYQRFDPQNCLRSFSQAIEAVREIVLSRSSKVKKGRRAGKT